PSTPTSFPTRRSSDLVALAHFEVRATIRQQPNALVTNLAGHRTEHGVDRQAGIADGLRERGASRVERGLDTLAFEQGAFDRRSRDRKSTRLNSSHDQI